MQKFVIILNKWGRMIRMTSKTRALSGFTPLPLLLYLADLLPGGTR